MNAQNAQSIGYEAGKHYFSSSSSSAIIAFQLKATGLSEEEYLLKAARNRCIYGSYPVRSEKTIALYVQGWQDAIDAHKTQQAQEQEEAARRAAIQHNPNTRFCTCAACMAE